MSCGVEITPRVTGTRVRVSTSDLEGEVVRSEAIRDISPVFEEYFTCLYTALILRGSNGISATGF